MDRVLEAKNTQEFYGEYMEPLSAAAEYVLAQTEAISEFCVEHSGRDPIESVKARIKSPDSMAEKLIKHGCEVSAENAVTKVYDAAGVRIVTSFLEDVDTIVRLVRQIPRLRVVEEKDYINHPKRNGYRSYHMICESLPEDGEKSVYVEIQIRTIAMDTWASVEHRMKYKKDVSNDKVIVDELKRCADELASVDLSLQTLREIICGGMENEDTLCRGRESVVGCRCGNTQA